MVRYRGTHFTERQVRVLELRAKGMTLTQIAEVLGVTPSTVSKILKSAEAVVERCRETLRVYEAITSPGAVVEVGEGDPLEAVVERVYEVANNAGIKVRYGSLRLYELLREGIGGDVSRGRYRVLITRDGDVIVSGAGPD